MNSEQIRQAWLNELHRVEAMGTPTLINSTRRFWKNEWHPYGWQVGFKVSVRFADGQLARLSFSDIGTSEGAAVANALRGLGNSGNSHPQVKLLWDELMAKKAVVDPYLAKVQQWRKGWFVPAKSNSCEKLTAKFHAMRRAAVDESHRPSRSLCTALGAEVCAGKISYSDAVAKIVAAGGVA